MTKEKVKAAIISGSDKTSQAIKEQLDALLGKYITFTPFSQQKWKEQKEAIFDLALASTHILARQIAAKVKDNTTIISLRRTLLKQSWEKVLAIPPGTKLALVNDLLESAEETISLLYELGARHIELIPAYPGNIPDTEMVITPGESQLVPPHVKQIIDIGQRVVDVSTIIDILTRFSLLNDETRKMIAAYSEQIIPRNRGLQMTLQALMNTKNLLHKSLNLVPDGVIAYDNQGYITLFNQSAEQIFRVSGWDVIGRKIEDFLHEQKISHSVLQEAGEEHLIHVNQQDIVLNKLNMESDGLVIGGMFTLQVLQKVEELELKLRSQVKTVGHKAKYSFRDIITRSKKMKQVVETAEKVASTHLNVLILGESGTGKELFAHAIHQASKRAAFPFVAVNCSALPDHLLESELFGYEEGAFTGARKGGKPGLFELAHRGTIFLDEIGDISPNMQSRLLRVIQQKEVLKIGGTQVLPVDVRIVAATNRDLQKMVCEGKFRADLYYRLNVVPIVVPPLRERKEDILALAEYFLQRRNDFRQLPWDVQQLLLQYHWPGNVRELENTMEYLACMSKGSIEATQLPFLSNMGKHSRTTEKKQGTAAAAWAVSAESLPTPHKFSDVDVKFLILQIIYREMANGNTVGRKKLVQLAKRENVLISEYELRKILDALRKEGLIEVSVGRSGCKLTESGYKKVKQRD